MIPKLHWWISSSLLCLHFNVIGALWRLWHGTLRGHTLLELGLKWGPQTSWLQPFLSDHTQIVPVKTQRGGCSQGCPVQEGHEGPQQHGTSATHILSLPCSPPALSLLGGCNWRQKELMLEERKPTDECWASEHPLTCHPFSLTPCTLFLCAPSVPEHPNRAHKCISHLQWVSTLPSWQIQTY